MGINNKLSPDLAKAARNIMTFCNEDIRKISDAVIGAFEGEEDIVVELPELSEAGLLNVQLIKGELTWEQYLDEIQILNDSLDDIFKTKLWPVP